MKYNRFVELKLPWLLVTLDLNIISQITDKNSESLLPDNEQPWHPDPLSCYLNGSQLAKIKKSIPDMSLPRNL